MVRKNLYGSFISILTLVMVYTGLACPGATPESQSTTIILVHGAWTGGWIWKDIELTLAEHGYRVYAPTLSGMGGRVDELSEKITLSSHANEIKSLIKKTEARNVILVGHSYGGLVISEVAAMGSDNISKLIYLDALVPLNSQTGADIIGMPFSNSEEARQLLGETWWRLEQQFQDERFTNYHPTLTFFHKIDFGMVLETKLNLTYVWFEESVQPPLSEIAASVRENERWQFYSLPMAHYDILHQPEEISQLLLQILIMKL
jgi:pimeloyl-ACP methyl ester carboxylesterase